MSSSNAKTQRTTLPPGPKPLPLLGNLLAFRRDPLGFFQQLERTYGGMATVYFGKMPLVLLFRPEHVRYVLTENPLNFTNRETALALRELIGDGLLTIDGEAHREQRRLVQPAFHKKRVESYAGIMVQYAQEMLASWLANQQLDVAREMQALTLRIVAKCLFNVDLTQQVDALGFSFSAMINNQIGLLEGLLRIRIDQPFTSYGRRMAAKRKVDAFIYDLIAQRREQKDDVGDVLSMLLAAHDESQDTRKGYPYPCGSNSQAQYIEGRDTPCGCPELNDTQLLNVPVLNVPVLNVPELNVPVLNDTQLLNVTQIHDHILTFVAAGHETTANWLTWTFFLLSQYPQVREKLLRELQTVLAGRAPTVDDLPNLPYTEWVLDESLRIYPPAWAQGRRAVKAFDLDGVHFPAGTMVMLTQWVTHRLPDIWPEAEVFRPERWNPASEQKLIPWSYFPFGGGPRICIGMPFAQLEAKLLLATIFQQFIPMRMPGFDVAPAPLITLRPKNGLQVVLVPTTSDER